MKDPFNSYFQDTSIEPEETGATDMAPNQSHAEGQSSGECLKIIYVHHGESDLHSKGFLPTLPSIILSNELSSSVP
jgi:hypothetical protein